MSDNFQLTHPRAAAGGNAENEHFPTPRACAAAAVAAVLELHWLRHRALHGGRFTVLEPGCGDAAPFLDAIGPNQAFHRIGCDVRPVAKPFHGMSFYGGLDYLDEDACKARDGSVFHEGRIDLIITNPPFSLAQQFIERSLQLVHPFGLVAMLLQMGIEVAKKRVEMWRSNPLLVKWNLVPRPVFVAGGDMREYAIYVWAGRGLAAALAQLGRSWSEVRTLQWRD